ncbi:MAG TPA: hypothetical protein VFC67_10375 [Prolixibacteraceae bacterium]|nr:hypothetical protein [Prolixibacteraceae bacterium]
MTTASLSELRRALKNVPSGDLPDLCIRLARYKKENKELLSYLLFEVDDEPEYIKGVKTEIDEHFRELTRSTPYMTKKGIRKALTFTNQKIRYSGQKRTEVELLIYFCKKFRKEISFRNNVTLKNIYLRQIQRIKKTLATLHEDLQFDFGEEVKLLE